MITTMMMISVVVSITPEHTPVTRNGRSGGDQPWPSERIRSRDAALPPFLSAIRY